MRPHLLGIDHAVILVRDLERAADRFRRMGFTLSPRGVHTLGSQNHCIMFGRDYVELMALPKPHPALQHFADFLAAGEGLGAVALATEDAERARGGLAAAGIVAEPALEFSRPVQSPEGTRDASFRIVQLAAEATPGCRMFLCQHFTRELVWRPELQVHSLGALGIAALGFVCEEPRALADAYARIFDNRPQPIAEGLLVDCGSAAFALATRARLGHRLRDVALPARPRPIVAALFIRVGDRARAARAIRRGGFAPIELADGSLALGADQACGVALVFG